MNNPNRILFVAKVVFVGHGATSVLKHHLSEFNDDSSSFWTVGLEPATKLFFFSDKELRMQIWNLSLSPGFAPLRKMYMQHSLGLLIFFHQNNRKSYDSVSSYFHDFIQSNQPKVSGIDSFSKNHLSIINLLSPQEETQEVSSEEANALASSLGVKYYEMYLEDEIEFQQILSTLAKAIISSLEHSRNSKI